MRLLKNHLRKSKNTGIRQQFDSISCFEKLVRCQRSLAPTLVTLPCISEIPFLDSCFPKRFSTIKSFANRRPNAATPGADGDDNLDREVYSVFSIAPHGGERRANGQSVVSHPRCGVRNNIGNTIGTSRADHRDESILCVAIPTEVATRSRQNNSATPAHDRGKVSRP